MRIDALTAVVASQPAKPAGAAQPAQTDARTRRDTPVERPAASQAPQEPQEPEESVAAAAKQIESYLKRVGRTLEFAVDAETRRTVVTVRDADTGDVIRQIPGDEVLKLARHLQSLGGSVNFKV